MLAVVFGAFGRDRPFALFEIDFRPLHFGHFAAALPEQEQELLDRAEWISQSRQCGPQGLYLVLLERPASWLFLDWRLEGSEGDASISPRPSAQLKTPVAIS